ncbi:ankyrin repeat and BTB/POZ domain-containing protein 2 [Fistulifera solaris]|uniref:Ankyrin repeat and BTB/POZ domain-containing protein 2 n=1 Tax=Fistulifera solaris TaxID=1519565 RepID=A0A1Z5KT99_FISSO|nr:ankyrin repeat and BTB/POZ domain-containing protein 2 [Fistulifera solaris]|eukprot:GAX29211.1 ankyrin repeat and BTB/POZ domain-containing protein 2 [Fistulifera solaris]
MHESMRWSEINHEHSTAPTIKNHSVTHFNGYLFCFGGYDGRRNHMTLLIYHIAEERWIRPQQALSDGNLEFRIDESSMNNNPQSNNSTIVVQGSPPPGRNGHSATLAVDDEENAKIVIIGGWLGTGPLAASDMHVLDVSAGGRQLRWYQPPIKGTPPGPCNMHSADYVAHRREVYVFRGGNGREYLNDLHALHVDTLTWRLVETNGEAPQPRANHSSAMLEHELCLFGGWNGTERLNDIHILDTRTSTWTRPRVGGVLPHPRAGMTLTALRGRLLLFGGSGTSAKCFNDLQILDRQEMVWLDVSQSDSSENRGGTAAVARRDFDRDDAPAFRFGGSDYSMTWHRNGRSSTDSSSAQNDGLSLEQQQQQQDGFSIRHGTDWRSRDMAGQIRDATASVRSMHVSPNPNDEDSVPTVVVHGEGPGRRAGHTATVVHRKVYVFGGSCGSDYLNDFFVLDTDPRPQLDVSEPNSLQLFDRRLWHFFNEQEFSDVTFLVQGQRVYGHKMVLSIVSDCFRAMFTTGFREENENEIVIRDCSHSAFLAMMEYIYTGSIPKSLGYPTQQQQNADIRQLDRIIEMLELADRFFLDHLKQVCENMLQSAVAPDTVEYLLQVSQKTNATQLQLICEHFIRNRGDTMRLER